MVFEIGPFLGAAAIGLAAWAADAFVKPIIAGFVRGDALTTAILFAVVGGLLMAFGGGIPFVKYLGKGAVVAGTFIAASAVLAPMAQVVYSRRG